MAGLQKSTIVIGVDEAGRGPLAGPVVAAAVWVKKKNLKRKFLNLKDSKHLSPKKREEIYDFLKRHPDVEWASARVGERVIDKINIFSATKLAMKRATKKLTNKLTFLNNVLILVDGNFKIDINLPQKSIIRGDEKIFEIKLASIVAKVERDRLMAKLDKKYPQYGFQKHKGYGTREHFKSLRKFGPCPVHRKTFNLLK